MQMWLNKISYNQKRSDYGCFRSDELESSHLSPIRSIVPSSFISTRSRPKYRSCCDTFPLHYDISWCSRNLEHQNALIVNFDKNYLAESLTISHVISEVMLRFV